MNNIVIVDTNVNSIEKAIAEKNTLTLSWNSYQI